MPHGRRVRSPRRARVPSHVTDAPTITLNNGVEIPQLGFGVFQIPPDDTKAATLQAFEVGYRHIDTAQMYRNEAGVGEAVTRVGTGARRRVRHQQAVQRLPRPRPGARARSTGAWSTLDIDYLDLFLIHWPLATLSDFVPTWQALEEMLPVGPGQGDRRLQLPGAHLRTADAETDTVPAVNQIEVHPYLTNETSAAYGAANGIVTEAWSPIAQGEVLDDPVLRADREARRPPAQVTLRWHLQRGDIVFPKSVTPQPGSGELRPVRLRARPTRRWSTITGLNRDERTGADPDTMDLDPGHRGLGAMSRTRAQPPGISSSRASSVCCGPTGRSTRRRRPPAPAAARWRPARPRRPSQVRRGQHGLARRSSRPPRGARTTAGR